MQRRHKTSRAALAVILLLVISGCLSPIDFDTKGLGNALTIGGQVSTIGDQTFVQVGRTSDQDRLPVPETNASVVLIDSKGTQTFFVNDNSGTYRVSGFAGNPGETYMIRVTTSDGNIYESSPETLPLLPGAISSEYEITTDRYVDSEGTVSQQPSIVVYGTANLPPGEKAYVKWQVDETYILSPTDFPDINGFVPPPCFISQNADPQRVTLFNGNGLNTMQISRQLLASRLIDETFLEKHYFTTYQSVITKEAFEYWQKVNVLANNVGSIFDTPPATIKGNLFNVKEKSEAVFGYFQATNQTFDRFSIQPTDLPFFLNFTTCTFRGYDVQYPTRCLDCTTVRNSSYLRPVWF